MSTTNSLGDFYIRRSRVPIQAGVSWHDDAVTPDDLLTERLLLRRWMDADREPFAAINADPEVMELFPSTLSRVESDAFADRVEAHFDDHGFGLWAVEVLDGGAFAGYVGLWPADFEAHFTPAVEVGWRLARAHWGRGYATEGALAAARDGFDRLGLDEIVSFTTTANHRSRRVMEKLGMRYDPKDDFDHPKLPDGHPIQPHVLYRVQNEDLIT